MRVPRAAVPCPPCTLIRPAAPFSRREKGLRLVLSPLPAGEGQGEGSSGGSSVSAMPLIRPAATFSRREKGLLVLPPLPLGESWGEGSSALHGRKHGRTLIRLAAVSRKGSRDRPDWCPPPLGAGQVKPHHVAPRPAKRHLVRHVSRRRVGPSGSGGKGYREFVAKPPFLLILARGGNPGCRPAAWKSHSGRFGCVVSLRLHREGPVHDRPCNSAAPRAASGDSPARGRRGRWRSESGPGIGYNGRGRLRGEDRR